MLNGLIDGPSATSLSKYRKTAMPSPHIPNLSSQSLSLSLLSVFLHPIGVALSLSVWCTCCCGGRTTCGWRRCLLPLSSVSVGRSTLELLQGGRIQLQSPMPIVLSFDVLRPSTQAPVGVTFPDPDRAPPTLPQAAMPSPLTCINTANNEVRMPPPA
jgi:hypothetical protein